MTKQTKWALGVLAFVVTATVARRVGQFEMKDQAERAIAIQIAEHQVTLAKLKTSICGGGGNPIDNVFSREAPDVTADAIKACVKKKDAQIALHQAVIDADQRVIDAADNEVNIYKTHYTKAQQHQTEELFYMQGVGDDQFCYMHNDAAACNRLTKHMDEDRARHKGGVKEAQ
jgi:hypothetical protein